MIYQVSGSFKKFHWEVKYFDSSLPVGYQLERVEKALTPFDYTVFLDSKGLPWGSDIIIELLSRAKMLISKHIICKQANWYNDMGQI